jgi:hypothetical protein
LVWPRCDSGKVARTTTRTTSAMSGAKGIGRDAFDSLSSDDVPMDSLTLDLLSVIFDR